MEETPVLVADLGSIRVDSSLAQFDPIKDYKKENNFLLLYDAYNFYLKDLQILIYENLTDYHKYSTESSTKILKDVTLTLKFYNCLEQKHPSYPLYEMNVTLESLRLIASDYVFHMMMKLKDSMIKKMDQQQVILTGKEEEKEDHDFSIRLGGEQE